MPISNTSQSKEKFQSVLSEIFEKYKDVIIDEMEDILEYDTVEITLLLKSIGFRLLSLEFTELPNENSNDIEIDIKCRKSGLSSKMILENKKCSCPTRKGTNNNSFWEVQGIDPSTPVAKSKGIIQDTSCNLLPDISKKTAKFSKLTLATLLQNYQTKFMDAEINRIKMIDIKQIVERFELKAEKNLIRSNSPIDKLSTLSTSESLKCIQCSTCSGSISPIPTSSVSNASIETFTDNQVPQISVVAENGSNIEIINAEITTENKDILLTNDVHQSQNQNNENLKQSNEQINEKDIYLAKDIETTIKHLNSALTILKSGTSKDLTSDNLTDLPTKSNDNGTLKASASTKGNRRHSTGSNLDKNDTNRKSLNQKSYNTNSAILKEEQLVYHRH